MKLFNKLVDHAIDNLAKGEFLQNRILVSTYLKSYLSLNSDDFEIVKKDGSLVVNVHRSLLLKNLNKIPVKFNQIKGDLTIRDCFFENLMGVPEQINGKLNISDCQNLKSLEGGPLLVSDDFSVSNTSLETLQYFPKCLKDISIIKNSYLSSLQGIQQEVFGNFIINYQNNLKILEHCPQHIKGNFGLEKNGLESLLGMATYIGGNVFINGNCLINLKGCPDIIYESFYCTNNQLESLEGCPQKIMKSFSCANNPLKTLEYGPSMVGENYICSENQLVSLKGAPTVINGHFKARKNALNNLEFCPQIIKRGCDFSINPINTLLYFPSVIIGEVVFSNNKFFDLYNIDAIRTEFQDFLQLHLKEKSLLEQENILSTLDKDDEKTTEIKHKTKKL